MEWNSSISETQFDSDPIFKSSDTKQLQRENKIELMVSGLRSDIKK